MIFVAAYAFIAAGHQEPIRRNSDALIRNDAILSSFPPRGIYTPNATRSRRSSARA
jgi:hypothetical protein